MGFIRKRDGMTLEQRYVSGGEPPERPATADDLEDYLSFEFFCDSDYKHIHGVAHPHEAAWQRWAYAAKREGKA